MSDVALQELLQEILGELRAISAGSDEILTEEQVAVRLSLSVPQLQRRMKDNSLPRGVVWFELPGLGRYFSWRALCAFITSSREAAVGDSLDEDEPIPQILNRNRGRKNGSPA